MGEWKMILPTPCISSFDLCRIEAFSIARIDNGELQFMTDIYTTLGCEFYHGKTLSEAAVFDPSDEVEVGWDDEMHTLEDFFTFWSDDEKRHVCFSRGM